MNAKTFFIMLLVGSLSLNACGQSTTQKTESKTIQNNHKMDIGKLTNETVKATFEAWQNGDSKTFLSYFAIDVKLYDDGNPRDFQQFVKDACGHEKFISIERIENNGLDITGHFHTENWGDFKTYFKFHLNNEGKINRLDIGQAN